jgi:hypothetical protein
VVGVLPKQLVEQRSGFVHIVQRISAAGQPERDLGVVGLRRTESLIFEQSISGPTDTVKGARQPQLGVERGIHQGGLLVIAEGSRSR